MTNPNFDDAYSVVFNPTWNPATDPMNKTCFRRSYSSLFPDISARNN